MKTSHFFTFISLILLEVILCVSFFFIYSGGLQKSYIEGLREYSKNISVEFKTGRFFIDSSDDVEAMEMMDKRLVWIQSTYRGNPLLMFHIYRSINNEVVFSYARNEQIDRLKSEYIRQWQTKIFRNSDFALVNLGNYNIISIRNEIDDDIRPVGKLELAFDYSPVIAEISKLKMTLIWFSSLLAVALFIAFLIVSILWRKKNNNSQNVVKNYDNNNRTKAENNNNVKEKVVYDNRKNPHKIRTINLERSKKLLRKDNDDIKIEDEIQEETEESKRKVAKFSLENVKQKEKNNNNDSDFLNDTKNKERSYIHKIRL